MRTTMNMRERIRTEMDAQGVTAKELARRAKLNETYIRDLLEGRSQDPKLSKILAVAHALGKDLSWLVEGAEPTELGEIIRRLPDRAKAEVIDFARYKDRQSGGDS
jgi:transcriptional regulator with XRE-family HTH domain